ncbi:hypothetical protein GCM10027425_20940 [Alteromonas gracilis]
MIAAVSPPPPPLDRAATAPRLGRRTTLALLGAGGLATVSACDQPRDEPSARRTVRSGGTDPDVALAAATLAALESARERIAPVGAALPRLRASVTPALDLVDAHIGLVREAVPDPPATPAPTSTPTPGDPATGRRIVRAELRRLQALLTEQSVRARSGAFAQLLAQMGAAHAQADYVLGGGR